MILSEYFNSKKTNKLIGFNSKFDFFKNLIEKNELPKVTMLSGDKGIGKSTFINHLTHFYFDKKNYNIDEKSFKDNKTVKVSKPKKNIEKKEVEVQEKKVKNKGQ